MTLAAADKGLESKPSADVFSGRPGGNAGWEWPKKFPGGQPMPGGFPVWIWGGLPGEGTKTLMRASAEREA
jgi:hypothetical protein